MPEDARTAVDRLAAALTPQLGRPETAPLSAARRIAAVLVDLREVAAALRIASASSAADDPAVGRPVREIHRELLQVIRALAALAATEPDPRSELPRTRHLRAASLPSSPPPGALALDRLLELLIDRGLGTDSRAEPSSAERVRGASRDLRAAALVLHRLEPRPASWIVARLAALATDLHRIAGGPAAPSIP